jgi:hypothetical protein
MKCKVDHCKKELPKVYKTQGYCSYHYRMKNEGNNPETYIIRKKAKPGKSLEFLKNAVSSESTACIIWKFGKDDKGYGAIHYNGKKYKAHRLALIFATGEEPDRDVFACHNCDIPGCVNPRHLYWGDAYTNARDQSLYATRSSNY